jgi:hypothetical protein
MICDGQGCSVIAHLNCYFSAGSQDANDAITDIEHWQCEKCGGLPRHMHLRPRAAKRARVSFDPDLNVVTESPITEGDPATGYQGGGWGGHWPTWTELAQLTTGKGKEAMEPPITTSQRTLEDCSARLTLQPDHDVVVETTTCYFCRRADRWLYLTCGVCQLTTHANCYYRLRSDEADYYEKNTSDWRCQDCGGPQRHTDCALSENGQQVQRHVGPRLPGSDYRASGDGDGDAGGGSSTTHATSTPEQNLFRCSQQDCNMDIVNIDSLDSDVPTTGARKKRKKKTPSDLPRSTYLRRRDPPPPS